ncbi:MAG TPA: hypothetical protein VFW76_02380 [Ktedonobacterales bacterium]|nr:hypothetical protein [Ktedonobacterales bacterium]
MARIVQLKTGEKDVNDGASTATSGEKSVQQQNNQPQEEATPDPHYHAANIMRMLRDVRNHARSDTQLVNDPKARALFETTAEVLGGLITAYEHYQQDAPAWR